MAGQYKCSRDTASASAMIPNPSQLDTLTLSSSFPHDPAKGKLDNNLNKVSGLQVWRAMEMFAGSSGEQHSGGK